MYKIKAIKSNICNFNILLAKWLATFDATCSKFLGLQQNVAIRDGIIIMINMVLTVSELHEKLLRKTPHILSSLGLVQKSAFTEQTTFISELFII